jgi:hypothetical protein
VRSLTKVQGTPFRVAEVEQTIHGLLREIDAEAAASGTDHGSPTNGSPTNGSPTNGSPTNGSTANEGATGR